MWQWEVWRIRNEVTRKYVFAEIGTAGGRFRRRMVAIVTLHQMFQFVIYVIAVAMSVVDVFEVLVPKQQVCNTVLHQWHHHLSRGMQVNDQQNPDCAFFHLLVLVQLI